VPSSRNSQSATCKIRRDVRRADPQSTFREGPIPYRRRNGRCRNERRHQVFCAPKGIDVIGRAVETSRLMRHRVGAEWSIERECSTGEHGRPDPESYAVRHNRILGASHGSQPSKRECQQQ
jgi:hypothetical protein